MATVPDAERDPWPEYIESHHLLGDYYYIAGKYSRLYWALGAILAVTVPPAGVFLLAFFAFSSIHTPDDEIDLDLSA
jgi:hypothetical protein